MASTVLFYVPRLLLTLISFFLIIVPYIADYNETHVFNPKWPGHAKFHNGQTMSMGVYLGSLTLWKTWSTANPSDNLFTATVIAAAYLITMFSAYYYPGATAWDPPQRFGRPDTHLLVVLPMLSMVVLAWGLEQWRVGWEKVVLGQVVVVGAAYAAVWGGFVVEQRRKAGVKARGENVKAP